jgi:hypothetical protein
VPISQQGACFVSLCRQPVSPALAKIMAVCPFFSPPSLLSLFFTLHFSFSIFSPLGKITSRFHSLPPSFLFPILDSAQDLLSLSYSVNELAAIMSLYYPKLTVVGFCLHTCIYMYLALDQPMLTQGTPCCVHTLGSWN